MSRLEIDSRIRHGTSRIRDCVNFLNQMLRIKDLENADAICIRASIALLFGADFVSDKMVQENDALDLLSSIFAPALASHDVLPYYPRTGSDFAACMADDDVFGAFVFTSETEPHVIGIIPESSTRFLVVDTNSDEKMFYVDEAKLIDLYANSRIPFPEMSSSRSVVIFRNAETVMIEMFPYQQF